MSSLVCADCGAVEELHREPYPSGKGDRVWVTLTHADDCPRKSGLEVVR